MKKLTPLLASVLVATFSANAQPVAGQVFQRTPLLSGISLPFNAVTNMPIISGTSSSTNFNTSFKSFPADAWTNGILIVGKIGVPVPSTGTNQFSIVLQYSHDGVTPIKGSNTVITRVATNWSPIGYVEIKMPRLVEYMRLLTLTNIWGGATNNIWVTNFEAVYVK